MIRVNAYYQNSPDAKFDFDYYAGTHFPMVMELMRPYGAIRFEVERCLSGSQGEAPRHIAVGTIYFEDMARLQEGLGVHVGRILADVPNYTNLVPDIQFGEVL